MRRQTNSSNNSQQLKATKMSPCRKYPVQQKKKKRKLKAAEHLDFLSLIGKSRSKKIRAKLLDIASKGQVDAILECIDNVHRRNVAVPAHKVQQLRRHTRLVQNLKTPRTSLQRKKQLLAQSGGFLSSLIPIAIAALGKLFGG